MRGQKCRGFTPRQNPYGNEPLKQLAPFAIAERIIAKPVGPDSLIGYLETSYYSELNYGSSTEGRGRNEQVNNHTRTYIYKARMQACTYTI